MKFKKIFARDTGENAPETDISDASDEKVSDDGSVKEISEYTLGEIGALKADFGDRDVLSDVMSEQFAIFNDGRNGKLYDSYALYVKFKNSLENKEKDTEVCDAGTEKRLHSGFAESSFKDASYGLTARQMDMARSAGMSFREYEELLGLAHTRTRNKL